MPGRFGRSLAAGSVALLVVGGGLVLARRYGFERLPGNVEWRSGSAHFLVPLGLVVVLSLVLTLVLNLFRRR